MINYKSKIALLMLCVCTLIFGSCDHDTDTIDGPSLVDRFGDFALTQALEASSTSINLSENESIYFSAEFNKNVAWRLELVGQSTGAVKIIEGFSKIINQDNATWTGGTTTLPLFNEEVVKVTLVVEEEPDLPAQDLSISVMGNKSYEGLLFTDFENSNDNLLIGNFEYEFASNAGRQMDVPAQGSYYLNLRGTDSNNPNYFVGLIDVLVNEEEGGSPYLNFPVNVAEEMYFNCFMYSDGRPHGLGIIDFIYDANDSGAFEENGDQLYRIEMDYDLASWSGWRQISHPLSEVGLMDEQLDKILGVRLILISNLNTQPQPPIDVGFGIDYLIFTQGSALEI